MDEIPFKPDRRVDEWEYSVRVDSLRVTFCTQWQFYAAANSTYQWLKEQFPQANVQVFERKISRVQEVTP